MKSQGKKPLLPGYGDAPKLEGMAGVGTGGLYDKEKAQLGEIIAKVNDLFDGGELTEGDKLGYVNGVIKSKMMENETLREQAAHNSKEQFSQSPTLDKALVSAVIDALVAHESMSKQALNSERVMKGLKEVLLGPAGLYEELRGGVIPPA